jgi:hypothetical protein
VRLAVAQGLAAGAVVAAASVGHELGQA